MKLTLLLPVLFLSSLASAQMLYEHTFFDGAASRVVLENSGEKYYLVDQQQNAIKFYNADYSMWKTIPLVVPVGTLSISVSDVSELKINPDANIEISCSFYTYTTSVQFVSQIVNELGTILLSVPDCRSLVVDQQEGLPVKIISATGGVYSVPDLLPEHNYTEGNITRVKLDSSGEKYYALDGINNLVNVYNADHSLWKVIVLTTPDASVTNISLFGENQINTDNLIEVGFTSGDNSKIINENGGVILTVDNCFDFRISKIIGLPDKILADKTVEITGPWASETEVFSVPGFNSEHIYEGLTIRVMLENSGEKYYTTDGTTNTTDATIYNSDHTPWKTFALDILAPYPNSNIIGIYASETKFDTDNQVELSYSYAVNTLDGGHFATKVIKEDGTVLLNIAEAYVAFMSEFPGLLDKFIVAIQYGPFNNQQSLSRVFGINGTFAVEDFGNQPTVVVFPNPAQNEIKIESQTRIVEAYLYDTRGTLVQHYQQSDLQLIDIGNLSPGFYLLRLSDCNDLDFVQKIIVR